MDAARYVPSSSSKNKLATAVPPAATHRTTAAAAATAFRVGDGLWSSSRVRRDGRRLRHVDGRQRAAVASAWPHCAHCCQRGAARAGDPAHP